MLMKLIGPGNTNGPLISFRFRILREAQVTPIVTCLPNKSSSSHVAFKIINGNEAWNDFLSLIPCELLLATDRISIHKST